MKFPVRKFSFLLFAFLFAATAKAQVNNPQLPKSPVEQRGFTWTETFEGSGNTDGFITDVNSTFGYAFNAHFSVDFGIPFLFVNPSTSKTGTTSVSSFGNPYLGMTYSRKSEALNYGTSLNGSIPASTTAKGLSTGRVTFDWSNHFDHDFGNVTPFLDLGIANSVSDTRYFHRPFISLGKLAHFEAGPEFDLGDKWSVTASGYYILPWGPQKIYERGKEKSSGGATGGPSLTRDAGANIGLDYQATRFVDLSAGYSYSSYYVLNTYSFGIAFNVASMLKAGRGY
jgi:hypothetical protein